MTFAESLLPEFEQEMANTRKLLQLVPLEERNDFAPHPKSMKLGPLASHVADIPAWLRMTLESELLELQMGYKPFAADTSEMLLQHFDESVNESSRMLRSLTDEDAAKTWTFRYGGQTILSQPRREVLRSMVMSHLIHHRAQLGVYLRLNEIEIPGMYGPSADEMKSWRKEAAAE